MDQVLKHFFAPTLPPKPQKKHKSLGPAHTATVAAAVVHTVGHSQNTAVVEKCKMTGGLAL